MKFSAYPIIFFAFAILFFGCNSVKNKVEEKFLTEDQSQTFICNVEDLDSLRQNFTAVNNSAFLFSGVDLRSSEFSHSGQYSVKLHPQKPYGLTAVLKGINADDYIQVTAWRKSESDDGIIVFDGGKGFYNAGKAVVQQEENGWKKIFVEYFVPPNFNNDSAKIYVWNKSQDTIYFDDLEIIKRKHKVYPEFDNTPHLFLYIDSSDIKSLDQKRNEAFQTGVLMNSDEHYANVILLNENKFFNGKLRLKGDLTDHLLGEKWSFRIKLKENFAWKHLRTFSVQNPLTRYFLHEWLAHEIFEQEDILTTRYGFVPLSINNKSLGIYAYEEHFEKQLVESRNRREGPIIRFNEDVFWERNKEASVTRTNLNIDYFSAAKIIPFKEGAVTGDSLMLYQFEEAQNLLYQFKYREKLVSQIFDVDKLAKYYAVLDLNQAYHGFAWHNQRFYYNPVTCLLEPIAFDGYTEAGIFRRFDEAVSGMVNPGKMVTLPKEELMLYQVFCDSLFNAKYIEWLTEFSNESYIEEIENTYRNDLDSMAELIKQEFPYYKFDFNYLEEQAARIRDNLPAISENVYRLGEAVRNIPNERFKRQYTKEINDKLLNYQVQAFYNREKNEIKVLNFANSEVQVLGVLIKKGFPESFETGNVLAPFNGIDESFVVLKVENEPKKLLFSVNNTNYEVEVNSWKAPGDNTHRQNIKETKLNHDLTVTDGKVILEGNYKFDSDVVIPANLEFEVRAGTKIDLVNNAGFFCFSPVKIEGTEANPVEIISSDRTANGFNVLQPQGRSSLKFVRFSGLGSIRKKGWQTPAAITFYEADADLQNCTFANNSNCDDALNMVRSDFDVRNCYFENTFADAFDSDFCTGLVSGCTFKIIGNDAIDFSGSMVRIVGCRMQEISDKAISGGEKSTLTVENCDIGDANIGVASKDLSLVKLNKITMKNVVYGLVAFQKKPEYGPANIEIENLKIKNKISFHKIEEGSTLRLNGRLMEGREKKLALKLYQ